jgi:uncharacterized integral membrane protein (TIGR00697 family)
MVVGAAWGRRGADHSARAAARGKPGPPTSPAGRAPDTLTRPLGPRSPSPMTVPAPTATAARFGRAEAYYAACCSCFVVVLVLTNIIGTKLFMVFPDGRPGWLPGEGPIDLTAGIITYPITFLLTDIVAEIWGRKRASFMVVLGFAFSVLMLGIVKLGIALPPGSFWGIKERGMGPEEMQMAFEGTFFFPGLLLFSSMLAYLVAQLFDVRLYHFWWRITGGRNMWIRNNGSTMISQLVDTIIVNGIFLTFGLDLEPRVVAEIIVNVYVFKVCLAVIDTPLIYAARAWMRRALDLPREAGATAPLA